MSPAIIEQTVTAGFLQQDFWKVVPHLNRTQAFVEKNESGPRVVPVVTRVGKSPHSELVASSPNETVLGRYTVSTFHGNEKLPSANVSQHSVREN